LTLILDNIKTTHGKTHPYSPLFEATPFRSRGIRSDEIETVILKYNRTKTKILPYQHIPTSAWASGSKHEGAPRSWPARELNPSGPKPNKGVTDKMRFRTGNPVRLHTGLSLSPRWPILRR